MGIPVYITKSLAAADADGIAESQTPGAAGDLDLDGVFVVNGVAVLDTSRQVLLTFGADETGTNFTVYGYDRYPGGNLISEVVAGTATTAVTTRNFAAVTRVAISAAGAGTVTVGTNGVGATQWVHVNYHIAPVNQVIAVDVTGTVNYTVQYTYDDYWTIMMGQTQAPVPIAWDDAVLVGETTSGETTFAFPITGWRVLINSGTGSLDIAGIQAGFADS